MTGPDQDTAVMLATELRAEIAAYAVAGAIDGARRYCCVELLDFDEEAVREAMTDYIVPEILKTLGQAGFDIRRRKSDGR